MAQTIKLKRSATAGAAPTTSQLELGEVAINTYDGKMYIKKSVGGTESIVEISGGGGASAADAIFEEYLYTATNNQTAFSGNDDNSSFLSYVSGAIQVFLNGVLLDPETDYTATNGATVTLTSAAATDDYLQIIAFKKKISDGSVTVDTFSGNNSTTAFTLSLDPGDENNTRVFIDGVYQSKSNYTVSGTTLTFSSAPPSGTSIEVEIGNRVVSLDTASNIDLPDNVKLRLGASQDLEIYHNGSNSYIVENGTGDLFLGATNLRLTNGSVASTYLQGIDGGAVDIRHNNLVKLATTSTGIQVTGNIANASGNMTIDTAGDLILDAANNDIILKDDGTTFGQLTNDSGNLIIYNSGSQMLKGLSTGPNAEFIGTVKIPKLGINASANSNYSLYTLQNGSITHAAYLQVNGGTATGLEINASASSAYSGDVLYARQSSRNTGGNLARFANSDGDKFTLTTAGQATFSNDVIIGGNLTVNGSTTTINSTTLTVDDLNITLASGAANASAANGAGITVDGASATLTYVSSTDSWDFNKKVKFNTVQAHGSNNFLVDSPGEIILDSSSRIVRIYHDGGNIGAFQMTNNDFYVRSMVADRDLIFQGYDGSSNITALSLDMSEAGKAIFNAGGSFTGDVTVRSGNKLILNRADNATGGEITYGPTGTGFIINDVNGDDTIFKTGSSEHMRIHSNGNVGIGTGSTALSVKFHAYTTGYPVAKFERYGSSAATRGWTQIGHSSLSYTGATGADTYIVTQHGFGVAVNEGTNALTITDGGLVGIGTSNPDEKLVVSGDGARIYINSADYHIAMIGRRGSSGTALDQGYIRLKDQGTNTVVLDSAGNSYFTGGSVGIGTNSPESELTLQDDDATLRIRSNTTTTKGLSLRYNDSGNFGELLVDHQGNNQLDMKYYALTHKFGRNDSSQFVTIADDGATTITSADSLLLKLNPTANNYGGIAFQYNGVNKGMSIFNSGMMVYGGESQVSTALQAGGQYGLFIHHSTQHVGIGMSNATPTSVLNVRGDGGSADLTFKTEDASANETFFVQDGGRTGVRYYPLTVGIPSSTAAASGAVFQVEEAGHLFVKNDGKIGFNTTNPTMGFQINPISGGGYSLYFDRGNSVPGGPNPWLGLFNDVNVGDSTYGWGFYDSNSDGSLQIWNRNNSTTGKMILKLTRGRQVDVGTLTSGLTGNMVINSEGGNPVGLSVKARTNRARIQVQDNDTSGYIIAEDSVFSLGFADALSANNLNINSSHNVGIGTTTPGAVKLYVTTAANGNLAGQFVNTHASGSYGVKIQAGSDSSNYGFIVTDKDNSNPVQFKVQGDGKVGIGTNSPGGKLDVQENTTGSLLARVWNPNTSGTGESVLRIANNGNNAQGSRLEFTDLQYYHSSISADRTNGIQFGTNATGSTGVATERMRISPAGKLTFTSTLSTSSFDLDSSGSSAFQRIRNTSSNGTFAYLELGASDASQGKGYMIKNAANSGNGLANGSLYLWNDGGSNDIIEFVPNGTISKRVTINESGELTARNTIHNDSPAHAYMVLDSAGAYESGLILKRAGVNKWEGPYISGSTSDNDLKFYSYGDSSLQMTIRDGVNGNGGVELRGFGISDGSNYYGHYGALLLDSTNNYTGSARSWMITNAYAANHFGILRGASAGQFPVLGTGGGTGTNTSISFSMDNGGNATFHEGRLVVPYQTGFIARGNTSQYLNTQASAWQTIKNGIADGANGYIGVNLTESSAGVFNAYDNGSCFDLSNGRFTAPVAGKYMIYGNVYGRKNTTTTSDYMHFNIWVNGSNINQAYTIYGHGRNFTHDLNMHQSQILFLDANDYVEYRIYSTSTSMEIYGDHIILGAMLLA